MQPIFRHTQKLAQKIQDTSCKLNIEAMPQGLWSSSWNLQSQTAHWNTIFWGMNIQKFPAILSWKQSPTARPVPGSGGHRWDTVRHLDEHCWSQNVWKAKGVHFPYFPCALGRLIFGGWMWLANFSGKNTFGDWSQASNYQPLLEAMRGIESLQCATRLEILPSA